MPLSLNEFAKFADEAKQRRETHTDGLLTGMAHNLSDVEDGIRRYRENFECLGEMLSDHRYEDCLYHPRAYQDVLDCLQFAEFMIPQLLQKIALDRRQIEIRMGQDLVFAPRPEVPA
jgi:hypothetical protein